VRKEIFEFLDCRDNLYKCALRKRKEYIIELERDQDLGGIPMQEVHRAKT
jgi:hypothetical protein